MQTVPRQEPKDGRLLVRIGVQMKVQRPAHIARGSHSRVHDLRPAAGGAALERLASWQAVPEAIRLADGSGLSRAFVRVWGGTLVGAGRAVRLGHHRCEGREGNRRDDGGAVDRVSHMYVLTT